MNTNLLNELKWHKFPVLDDGFVCLVDVMGDDNSIVQAARVSYGEGTRKKSDNRTLIRYLMRHRHTTPFEMAEIKFLVRVPMDCWRQWVRHRTANINEYSTRYSLAIDSAQQTPSDQWRVQALTNKQGSEGLIPEQTGQTLSEQERSLQRHMKDIYNSRVEVGVAREQARKDLPLSTYTEAYWKIDIHNLLHFLSLRMEDNAQLEIRQYAMTIGEQIVSKLFPITWEAFIDYRVGSMTLSRLEVETIRKMLAAINNPAENFRQTLMSNNGNGLSHDQLNGLFSLSICEEWRNLSRCRERDECKEHLKKLGILN